MTDQIEAKKAKPVRRAVKDASAAAETLPAVAQSAVEPVTSAIEAAAEPAVALTEAVVEPTLAAASPAALAEDIEAAASPAVDSDIIVDAAGAAPIFEGLHEMATVTATADAAANATADKAQAMFGDMTTRFKGAFEKSTRLGEELVEFAKGNVEAVVASARVAAKAGEALSQEAADYGKKNLEHATAAFKSFATVKSPTELFQLQSDFAKSSFDGAVAEASRMSEAMMKFAGEIAQPLSSRYALAAEKFKAAAL